MTTPTLTVRQLGTRWWWVVGLDYGPCGPRGTRAEAEELRRGLLRTYRHWDEPGFVTCNDPRSRGETK